jgi:hypothetical protein
MILPTKHISLSSSLIGVSAEILRRVDGEKTVTYLWEEVRSLPNVRTFEVFTLSLDFLYSLGIVDFESGLLRRVKR